MSGHAVALERPWRQWRGVAERPRVSLALLGDRAAAADDDVGASRRSAGAR
jgi:hypothetical protein